MLTHDIFCSFLLKVETSFVSYKCHKFTSEKVRKLRKEKVLLESIHFKATVAVTFKTKHLYNSRFPGMEKDISLPVNCTCKKSS